MGAWSVGIIVDNVICDLAGNVWTGSRLIASTR
jgi:hypothetical protein